LAVRLFRKSAEQKNVNAQYFLGVSVNVERLAVVVKVFSLEQSNQAISKEGRFDGVDVRTSHNDPAFDFWQEYTWLPNEMPDCPGSPPLVKNTVIVTKSIGCRI